MTGTSSPELNALLTACEAQTEALIDWGIALEARVTALEKPATGGPACGLPGYTLDWEYTFGPGGTIPDIATLKTLFDPGLPWGVINNEWQRYVTDWNPANIVIVGNELHFIATPTRGIGDGLIDSAEIVSKKPYAIPAQGILEFETREAAGLGMWGADWLYALAGGSGQEIDVREIVHNQADEQRDTTKGVFVADHPSKSPMTESPGSQLDQWGKWVANGQNGRPNFDFATSFHTLAVQFDGDAKTRWMDKIALVTRTWKWTDPAPAIIVDLACGNTPPPDFPGQPNAASFQNGANVMALRAIRSWKK